MRASYLLIHAVFKMSSLVHQDVKKRIEMYSAHNRFSGERLHQYGSELKPHERIVCYIVNSCLRLYSLELALNLQK